MLGPRDLVLCAGTVGRASFEDHIAAAVAGGFQGISLYATEYQRARSSGLSDADMKQMLDDHGLEIGELDPLMNWVPSAALGQEATEEGTGFFGATEADFYAIAQALGARSINAVLFTDARIETQKIAADFAALCGRAAGHDLLVHLEFLPWTQIPDLASALAIVELADQPNGGVMFDSWHHFRSNAEAESLSKAPVKRILAVQLNDAPREPQADLIEETLHGRLLPGAGEIDLAAILAWLREGGSQVPIGVEVFSDELAELPAEEVGRRAGDAARAVIARTEPSG